MYFKPVVCQLSLIIKNKVLQLFSIFHLLLKTIIHRHTSIRYVYTAAFKNYHVFRILRTGTDYLQASSIRPPILKRYWISLELLVTFLREFLITFVRVRKQRLQYCFQRNRYVMIVPSGRTQSLPTSEGKRRICFQRNFKHISDVQTTLIKREHSATSVSGPHPYHRN